MNKTLLKKCIIDCAKNKYLEIKFNNRNQKNRVGSLFFIKVLSINTIPFFPVEKKDSSLIYLTL